MKVWGLKSIVCRGSLVPYWIIHFVLNMGVSFLFMFCGGEILTTLKTGKIY